MKKKLNCDNCGAPLHGCKCEYCGTEYEFDDIIKIVYERCDIPTEVLTCKAAIPLEYCGFPGAEEHLKLDMARRLTEEVMKYTQYETWIEPERMQQVLGAKVRVGVPR